MPTIIHIENVTIVRNGRVALDGVSLEVRKGENVAILGPNGCGKSTLVKAIARDLYPAFGRGSVRVGGMDRWNLFDLRRILGIVSNELQAICSREVTGLDVVISGFFGSYGVLEPYEVTDEMRDEALGRLKFLGACHLADRRTDELSSGEGRRVLIARSLVNDPSALLLDEPTTSLDMKSAHLLIQTLRRIAVAGTNLVLVTHHVEEVFPEIERVVLLRDGKVFMDGPTDLIMTSEILSELFESPIQLDKINGVYRGRVGGPA
ncbi:MAG: ATP-binding cassette domain-containing protein [Fimbriimonas sp.]|nr:ATP-binding cassette domain-containing protein [Fimbriimonas sp.]